MRSSRLLLSAFCLLPILAVAAEDAAPGPDLETLKQAHVEANGPALLDVFRKRTPSAEQRARIPALIRQLDSKRFQVRQEASRQLEEYGAVALPFLRAAGKGKSLEMARRVEACIRLIEHGLIAGLPGAAARLLRQRPADGACGVLLEYLPYADDRAVEEEVLATLLVLGLPGGKAEAALVRALKAEEPEKRAAAALVVPRSTDPDERAVARKLLTDRDARVRLRAAQARLRDDDREAVPVLLDLLARSPAPVALQAEEILIHLAGAAAPTPALRPGDPAERGKASQAWERWWRRHGEKAALPRMDDFRFQLGYTLVVEYSMGNGSDRVVELGPDGRPRWTIEDLLYPTDAVVLGENRVLIVEHLAKRVSERDFKGTVLWQTEVSGGRGPYAAQRLANGHTFIVSHHRLLEVNAAGKEVWGREADGYQYLGAHKTRDGQVVYLDDKGDCVRLDAAGKVAKSFSSNHATHWVSGIDVLPNENVLVPQYGQNKVVEFDPDGKAVWEAKVSLPKSATRLLNGRILVTSFENRSIVELDRTGSVLREYKGSLHPYRARRR